jgi:hypothetical protein
LAKCGSTHSLNIMSVNAFFISQRNAYWYLVRERKIGEPGKRIADRIFNELGVCMSLTNHIMFIWAL